MPGLELGIGFIGRRGVVLGIDLAFGLQLGANTAEFSSDLPRIDEVLEVESEIRKRADSFMRDLAFLLQLSPIRLGSRSDPDSRCRDARPRSESGEGERRRAAGG